jgi:hypothetical protein
MRYLEIALGAICFGTLLITTQACSSDDDSALTGGGDNGTSGGTSGTGGGGGGNGDGTSGGGGTSGGESTSGGQNTSGGTSGSTSGSTPGGGGDQHLIPPGSTWRKTMEWYRAIDTAPVAEHSGQMIGALAQWGTTGIFQIDYGISVLDGTGAQKVRFPTQEETDSDPVPIPAKGYIEGDFGYSDCPAGEDCHLLVLDKGANRLFEIYQANKSGAQWNGFLATWKMDKNYPRTNRGLGCSSADAAGLPIVPGLIGYKETKAGAINHALRFIIRNEYIRSAPNAVYPASHGTTAASSPGGVPYGGRLRLKKTITENDPRIKTPGAKALLRALQKYGMILADGGNIPLVAESVRVYKDANPAETWDGVLGPRDLGFIKPSDFEVIAIPKDNPSAPNAGWYQTRGDYEAQLEDPLGCRAIVQP